MSLSADGVDGTPSAGERLAIACSGYSFSSYGVHGITAHFDVVMLQQRLLAATPEMDRMNHLPLALEAAAASSTQNCASRRAPPHGDAPHRCSYASAASLHHDVFPC